MLALTFQTPGEVRLDERPDPEVTAPDEVVVEVEAAAVCGSDLHILHGTMRVEQGFTIGHEFVGTVTQAGDGVEKFAEGDRVVGCFLTSCGECWFCTHGLMHKCDNLRIFGHGEIAGDLQGSQAERVLVPRADTTLRKIPDGLDAHLAVFAGDVMATGFHSVRSTRMRKGDTVGILGLGPVGLCAVQAAFAEGAGQVLAVDSVPERLELAKSFGATPVNLAEQDVRGEFKAATEGRGADIVVEAVGTPEVLDTAIRLTRKAGTVAGIGAHNHRCEVHMGLVWNKGIELVSGLCNVHAHVDDILDKLATGEVDPSPIVSHRMPLSEAEEAYAMYDRREALKIVLEP
jgi:threonine dehydrogenase-like Zn-dependent dehydrogenase